MKKKLLIFGCLVYSLSSYSQFTAVPDPNFENYLEQNGMGDGVPNNGQVLTSNINSVITLNVGILQISDLTGIEDFIALEALACPFNSISTLDVSQNLALVTLYCASNGLTSLTLPASPNLEILFCEENFLTELDLTQNPNLIEVYCNWNRLTALDISQNPNLFLLWCNHNEIEGYFDTSQNIELNYFTSLYNNIIGFNLSQNINLQTFGGASNPIQALDVRNGNNENMQTFDVTDSDGLKCILVDDANATYLEDWLKDPYTTFVNNQQECDALGVADIEDQSFTMYPNPASNEIFLNLPSNGFDGLVLTLTNNLGQVLEENEPLGKDALIVLDVSGYAPGIYFVTIKSGSEITTKKLVVQ